MRFLACLLLFLGPFNGGSFAEAGRLGTGTGSVERALRPSAWGEITFDTFEDSSRKATWGSYQPGSTKVAKLEAKTYVGANFTTSFSAMVNSNKLAASSFFHKNFQNVAMFDDLKINFWYFTSGMKDIDHEFVVEYSVPGGAWSTLMVINRFTNGRLLEKTITLSVDAPLIDVWSISSIKLRFRCKGKDSTTKVWVDQIRFQGHLSATRNETCPVDRLYPPSKYEILPFTGVPTMDISGVEDDLSEISSLAFTDQTDANGNLFAYVASDKNQFSLKVIRFQRHAVTGQVIMGNATTVATYALDVQYSNSDWEDISLGPCSSASQAPTCIYIGDFGNNNRTGYAQRSVLRILKFPEPIWTTSGPSPGPSNKVGVPVTRIQYQYVAPGFNSNTFYDAEAVFVDWVGSSGVGKGDIYIVTKGECGLGRVAVIPASYHGTLPTTPSTSPDGQVFSLTALMAYPPVQGVNITCNADPFRLWQGADMRRDGRLIALITGQSPPRVYFYPRLAGQSVYDALNFSAPGEGPSCPYIASTSYGLKNETKHEAVAFLPDGKGFADTSECEGGKVCNVPIYLWNLTFPDSPDTTFRNGLVPDSNDGLWVTITSDDFETGDHLGSFVNGTRAYASQNYACPLDPTDSNTWSIHINEHKGPDSAIAHKVDHDASTYKWLKVVFDFLLDGFDHMDTLFLELSLDGGVSYFIVADWALDTQGIFGLGTCYMGETVVLNAEAFDRMTFGSQARLRFRTSANAANDRVYLDNIVFQGHI